METTKKRTGIIRKSGILGIVLVLSIMVFLSACGGSANNKEDTEDIIRSEVKATVIAHYGLTYSIKMCVVNVTSIEDLGDGEYEVHGKADITDDYDDKWEARFDGECTVDEDDARAHDMDYEEPHRQ